MRIRTLAAAFIVVLVAAACSNTGGTTTTGPSDGAVTTTTTSATSSIAPPTSVVTSTTTTVAGVEVRVSGCDDAEGPFEVLCRVVDLVDEEFVDEVAVDRIVAGAIEGIESITTRDASATALDRLDCAVPADAFAPICDAIASDVSSGDGTVADVVVQAIQGLLEFGIEDPFSAYLSPQALEVFNTNQSGAVEGIGALVQAREVEADGTEVLCNLLSDTCRIHIVTPLEGSPAEAVGIRSGDVIVLVDGEDVTGRTFDEVTGDVRGPAGTDVVLTMDRDGELLDFTVTRASIDIPITESRMLDETIGYLRLTSFTSNSAEVFRGDLQELIEAGAQSVIVDFQDNPGGSLNAAVLIASEFLDDGLVLRTEDRAAGDRYEVAPGGVATRDLRIVVLVDEGSASASEVVTGALQEAGRAVVIGENTFGKNTVQRIWGLPNGGGLKLTIARWVTPDGVDYGLDGIAPDIAIDIPDDATSQFLIDAAVEYLAQSSTST
jgi:carboxyl-terminal processing protease